jgi:predicted GNAT superfamily acetyltransferase
VHLRHLASHADYADCVALQREVWGASFDDCVPASILKVSQRIGGIAAGAFDDAGQLLGFVFGMTGVEGGTPVHWSDMLGVRAAARDLGIGRRLKEFQRGELLARGVTTMYWTYDPLVARNAHLNFNRLGVEAVEYVLDMYGDPTSDLHRGVGTDRLVVRWNMAPDAPRPAPLGPPEQLAATPTVTPAARTVGDLQPGVEDRVIAALAALAALDGGPPVVRVEVPPDVAAVQARSLAEAAAWRAWTRPAFTEALRRGYRIAGFYRDDASGRCFYVLALDRLSSP